jgi:hypothetical protein
MAFEKMNMILGWRDEYMRSAFAQPGDAVTDVYARRGHGGFWIELAVWRQGVIGAMGVSPYFSQGEEAGRDEDEYDANPVAWLSMMLGATDWHEWAWSDTTSVGY